jgi:hypothetical protein
VYDQDHQHTDDDSEFWDRMPDSRLDSLRSAWRERSHGLAARLPRPTLPARPAPRPRGSSHPAARRHHTDSIPVVGPDSAAADGASPRPAIDPLLRRTGLLALVIALLVPVAMSVRGGDDTQQRASSLQPSGAPADGVGVGVGVGGLPPAAPVESVAGGLATAAPAPASIDIAALPEAVPVNTPAPAATTAAAPPVTKAATPKAESAPAGRPSCGRSYTIAAGDAWVTIAKRHSVTTASLLSANGATRRTMLYPGRTICLPANASTPTTAKPAPATTAKPAPAPVTTTKPVATTPPPPARTYSRDEVIQIIREVWPDHLEDEAIRIATRESNLKPAARNYCCIGLFQIYFNVHKRWLATIGVTNANQLTDPRVNAYAAVTLWNRAGSWAPWRL